MSNNKSHFSPDDFTDWIGAQDLLANARRETLPYDAYGNETEFDVIVLSKPLPMNGNDAGMVFGTTNPDPSSPATLGGSISFKGRIVGGEYPSPHLSLPDPCNLSRTTEPGVAAKIVAMHTTFISNQGYVGKIPAIGDRVRISLMPGSFKYNLQFAYFNTIVNSTASEKMNAIAATDCSRLSTIFESFDANSDLGDILIQYAPMEAGGVGGTGVTEGPRGPVRGQFPVKAGKLTSPYGMRFHPIHKEYRRHAGIDIGAAQGTDMYSPRPGKVVAVTTPKMGAGAGGSKTGCGGMLKIKHEDGSHSRYCHCSKILVKVGDEVKLSTVVAKLGGGKNTPGAGGSTGPHLHFEAYEPGKRRAINPISWYHWETAMASKGARFSAPDSHGKDTA